MGVTKVIDGCSRSLGLPGFLLFGHDSYWGNLLLDRLRLFRLVNFGVYSGLSQTAVP